MSDDGGAGTFTDLDGDGSDRDTDVVAEHGARALGDDSVAQSVPSCSSAYFSSKRLSQEGQQNW